MPSHFWPGNDRDCLSRSSRQLTFVCADLSGTRRVSCYYIKLRFWSFAWTPISCFNSKYLYRFPYSKSCSCFSVCTDIATIKWYTASSRSPPSPLISLLTNVGISPISSAVNRKMVNLGAKTISSNFRFSLVFSFSVKSTLSCLV